MIPQSENCLEPRNKINPANPGFTAKQARELVLRHYGLGCQASEITSARDQDFRLSSTDGSQLILKIANSAEELDALECEDTFISYLEVAARDLPVPRLTPASDGKVMPLVSWIGGRHALRVMSYLPDEAARSRLRSPAFRRAEGRAAARLDLALARYRWNAPDRGLVCGISSMRARCSP